MLYTWKLHKVINQCSPPNKFNSKNNNNCWYTHLQHGRQNLGQRSLEKEVMASADEWVTTKEREEGRRWRRKKEKKEGKVGKKRGMEEASTETSARRSLNSIWSGTVMCGRELVSRNLGACPTGTTREDEEGKSQTQAGSTGAEPLQLKSARPRNSVHKNHVPGKINRATSRTNVIPVVDKRRICFVLYQQTNPVD